MENPGNNNEVIDGLDGELDILVKMQHTVRVGIPSIIGRI